MKKILSLILTIILVFALFAGCGDKSQAPDVGGNNQNNGGNAPDGGEQEPSSGDDGQNGDSQTPSSGDSGSADAEPADFSKTDSDMFTSRDSRTEYDEKTAIKIEFYGNSAAAGDKSVLIDGSTVTVTKEATYLISGTLNNGRLVVNAPDTAKLQLVLNGAHITSQTSAPLYIIEADKVFVTLVGENSLSSGESFEAVDENNIDGAVYSKQDLTFNGSGSLTVSSPAGHGIVCKDDLVFTGGSYTVTGAGHAIDANDSVRVKEATLNLNAGKDGIHAENNDDSSKGFVYVSGGTFSMEAQGDGIDAGAYLQIETGIFDITAGGGYENGNKQSSGSWGNMPGGSFPGGGGTRPGGGKQPRNQSYTVTAAASDTSDTSSSMKGLKANTGILISGGTFKINSADDGIHSDSDLTVNGGSLEIASGDDGMHAEENLTVTAGSVDITESYEGIEALHISIKGGDIKIKASDDGINAAGGVDNSGTGGRDNMFGGFGGMGGGGFGSSGNGSIVVSGGTVSINASGDGLDANGTLDITGGSVTVTGPTQGDTAVLDYDKTGTINGGTFIGTGSSMMAQSLSSSTQGVIAVSVGSMQAGTTITLKDKSGNVIISQTPELSYQIAIISSPDIKSGETYNLTVGTQSADVTAK